MRVGVAVRRCDGRLRGNQRYGGSWGALPPAPPPAPREHGATEPHPRLKWGRGRAGLADPGRASLRRAHWARNEESLYAVRAAVSVCVTRFPCHLRIPRARGGTPPSPPRATRDRRRRAARRPESGEPCVERRGSAPCAPFCRAPRTAERQKRDAIRVAVHLCDRGGWPTCLLVGPHRPGSWSSASTRTGCLQPTPFPLDNGPQGSPAPRSSCGHGFGTPR